MTRSTRDLGSKAESGTENDSASARKPRETLLGAAREIFSQFGFEGASVSAICKKAGMNAAQVNYHFQSKIELYKTLIASIGEKEIERFLRVLQSPSSEAEVRLRLEIFATEYLEWCARDSQSFRILVFEYMRGMPIAKDLFQEKFGSIRRAITEFLTSAREKNLIRADSDPQIATAALLGGLQSIVTYRAFRNEPELFDLNTDDERSRLASSLVETLVTGLKRMPAGALNENEI